MKLNNEQKEYLKKIIPNNYTQQIINLFKRKYNIILTKEQIKYFKRKNKINSGVDTTFKKGLTPHNKKPIGYEFVSKKDGYTYIKIGEPNIWEQKQRYIYKKYKGYIPKGYSIVFLDNNKQNFDLSNLLMVEDKDKLVAKNLHLFSNDSQITITGLLTAKLINTIHKKVTKN